MSHLILRVQQDFDASLRWGNIGAKLHTTCRKRHVNDTSHDQTTRVNVNNAILDSFIPTTFDPEYVIYESFINDLWAQRSDIVHICDDTLERIKCSSACCPEMEKKKKKVGCVSPLSMRKTVPILASRLFCSPSSTCSLQHLLTICTEQFKSKIAIVGNLKMIFF